MGIEFEIFDPAMCCATGVCGPSTDPALTQFAADLDWLRRQGVAVRRYNLSQEPGAFAGHTMVRVALERDGEKALPIILANGVEVSRAGYPTRAMLTRWAGLVQDPVGPLTSTPTKIGGCCGQGGQSKDRKGSAGCC